MRKTFFAFVFSVCAGAASASNVLNASGVADTALTAVNETVNGDAVGVWAQAMEVDWTNGYRGTGVRVDGFHTGVDVKAGPGNGGPLYGINISAVGGPGVYDVWGTSTYLSGDEWLVGHDVNIYGGLPIAFRANISGPNDVAAFQTTGIYAGGNAFGLQLYNGAYSNFADATGAALGDITSNGGNGYALRAGAVSGYYEAYGADIASVSGSGDTYGFRVGSVSTGGIAYGFSAPSVSGSYMGYGANVSGSGYYGGYGVYAVGNAEYPAYGVYAQGYSQYGDGVGIYAYGYSTSGNSVAAFLDGDVYASGGSCTYCSPSDQMFKKNIQPLSGGLKTVMALKPKTYEMKTDEYKDKITLAKGKQRGFIAQELKEVLPDMVHEVTWPARLTAEERKKGVKKEGTKFNAVSYMDLIPVLVQAVQEQQAVIKALEDKVARLEAR